MEGTIFKKWTLVLAILLIHFNIGIHGTEEQHLTDNESETSEVSIEYDSKIDPIQLFGAFKESVRQNKEQEKEIKNLQHKLDEQLKIIEEAEKKKEEEEEEFNKHITFLDEKEYTLILPELCAPGTRRFRMGNKIFEGIYDENALSQANCVNGIQEKLKYNTK